MDDIKDFVEISKYLGERYDLIQAGGGNTSLKSDNGKMYIKASGVYLSDIDKNNGYSIVDYKKLSKIFDEEKIINEKDKKLKDKYASQYIAKYNLTPDFRPSIETLLHIIMKKYTLHTHPIAVNAITLRKDCEKLLNEIFKGKNIAFIDYKTPGIELATELKKHLQNKTPQIIFLQNHGLITTSDDKKEALELTEYAVKKIEKYLNINLEKYKNTNFISSLISDDYEYISYLCEDMFLNSVIKEKELLKTLPFCPDKMVYCGVKTLVMDKNPKEEIEQYKKSYFDIPRVILYKKHLYFIAKTIKKAKETEDVFKFHIMALNHCASKEINFLSKDEIKYIGNWEAEKYRQNLGEKICK